MGCLSLSADPEHRDLALLTDAELADLITTWSGRVAAGEARLLALIGEFDAREAWGGPGLLSCAQWLSWRTGLSPGPARERVRVARALRDLPRVAAAMSTGRMSFSQARAVTRVATPDDQERWVELCRFTTAGQLERLVRGVRRARRIEQDEADPERAGWRRRVSVSYDADGDLVLSLRLPATDGAVLLAALEQAQAELDRQRAARLAVAEEVPVGEDVVGGSASDVRDVSAETPEHPRASLADAMLELARRTLDSATPDRARRSRARLTPQVDPLSGWARLSDGELLPPAALRGVASLQEAMRSLPGREGPARLRPQDLTLHDLGRTARLPSQALRDLLGTIDGEWCRFPGCTRRRLHAHHVRRWSDGGPTDLANLLLLCGRHHTLVHAQGFLLDLAADRSLIVRTADGVPVPHFPALPWGDPHLLDPHRDVSAETPTPDRVDRMDLDYCVAVLMQQAA